MSAIERELKLVTGIKQEKDEPRQKFLARLIDEGYKLKSDAWDKLSKDAQKWFNEAAKATDSNPPKNIPEPPDASSDEPEKKDKEPAKSAAKADDAGDDDKQRDDERDEKRSDRKARGKDPNDSEDDMSKKNKKSASSSTDKDRKKSAKSTAPEKKNGGAAAAKKNGPSQRAQLYEMIIRKPNISTDELIEKLATAGHKPSRMTISTLRSDVRGLLKLLVSKKMLEMNIE